MKKCLSALLAIILFFFCSAISETAEEDESFFEIHFLDVGEADAALVICDNKAMLIDGGDKKDSSLIYAYLKNHNVTHLDYIVASHAHEDHVGGLAGALNYATVDTAYCPITEYDTKAFSNFKKYLEKKGVEITIPTAGEIFTLGSATVQILGPINYEQEKHNNLSIIMKIVYGNTSFLFTGDAEHIEEQDMLEAGYDIKSTLLKVCHHGSEVSNSYHFIQAVMPQYAIISTGDNNPYGHPAESTLSKLIDADAIIYRTDINGTIICTSDGESLSFTTKK